MVDIDNKLKMLLTELADRGEAEMLQTCIAARKGDETAIATCLAYIEETNRVSAAVCDEVYSELRKADRKAYYRLPKWAR